MDDTHNVDNTNHAEGELDLAKLTATVTTTENEPVVAHPDPNDATLIPRNKRFRKRIFRIVGDKRTAPEIINEFASITTTHGLGRISHHTANKSWLWAGFWFCAFVVAAYFCAKNMESRISAFLKDPVTSTVSYTTSKSMEFPELTFCLFQPFSGSKFEEITGIEPDVVDNFFAEEDVEAYFAGVTLSQGREILREAAVGIEKVLLPEKSRFGSKKIAAENFTTSFFDEFGNCFTLRVGNQVKPGSRYGVTVSFDIDDLDALASDFFPSTESQGIQLYVHTKNEPIAVGDPILLAPGKLTSVELTRVDRIDNTDKKDCKQVQPNERYSFQGCLEECIDNRLSTEVCRCNRTLGDCQMSNLDCFDSESSFELVADFCAEQSNCKAPCTYSSYDMRVSSANVFSYTWADYLSTTFADFYCENMTADACRNAWMNDVAIVKVFFSSFTSSQIESTNSFTIEQLLSELGGTAGLFIGCSFLSIVELFELFYVLMVSRYYHARKTIKRNNSKAELELASSVTHKPL